jgi:primosomal protein N' (replication factor Y) (superfamily II helicase)
VPSPLRKTFDYLPRPDVPPPQNGARVRVRFGKRSAVGIVVSASLETTVAAEKLRTIDEVLDDSPLLDAATLRLYRWASDYYMCAPGLALFTSLPRALREGRPVPGPGVACWRLSAAGISVTDIARAPRQDAVLKLLKTYGELTTAELTALLGQPAAPVVKALLERKLVEGARRVDAFESPCLQDSARPLALNTGQRAAFAAVRAALGSWAPFLLEGVTGSGKTEVYLQLIAEVLARGQQVLVLVPEISLTPQTMRRFTERFRCKIAAFNSALGESQRCESWLAARAGTADIAVFAPLPRLGLIVVDEEHDGSYKQQDGFRYSARDVAIYRAQQHKVPIMLGSATPSLESLHNALSNRYQLLQLVQRAGGARPPEPVLLDLKLQPLHEGFSPALLQNIRREIDARHQVLVFLNRRGFAPLLLCHACGWIAECPRCERSYTLHRHPAVLRCHHCDGQKPLPATCAACGSVDLSGIGLGTERSEALLQAEFPGIPIHRIDRDTTRAKGALDHYMDQVHTGLPCILVGTQMLAKGHHFPRVTLVAVLDADSGLFSADFRGQELLGQLLTQVGGRAGRGAQNGRVLIQTWHPTHPVLRQLVQHGYGSFARGLLEQRRKGRLPPFVHSLLIRAEAAQRAEPLAFLQRVRAQALDLVSRDIDVLGPLTSPIGKRAGQFRAQLILLSPRRAHLQRAGHALIDLIDAQALSRRVRWSVDVDPLDYG